MATQQRSSNARAASKKKSSGKAKADITGAIGVRERIRCEIAAVILVAVGAFLVFGLYVGAAGKFGEALTNGLCGIFGYMAFAFPFFLIAYGVTLLAGKLRAFRSTTIILVIAVFVLFSILLSIHYIEADGSLAGGAALSKVFSDSVDREAGGILGMYISMAIIKGIGMAGVYILVFALLIITIILTVGVPMSRVAGAARQKSRAMLEDRDRRRAERAAGRAAYADAEAAAKTPDGSRDGFGRGVGRDVGSGGVGLDASEEERPTRGGERWPGFFAWPSFLGGPKGKDATDRKRHILNTVKNDETYGDTGGAETPPAPPASDSGLLSFDGPPLTGIAPGAGPRAGFGLEPGAGRTGLDLGLEPGSARPGLGLGLEPGRPGLGLEPRRPGLGLEPQRPGLGLDPGQAGLDLGAGNPGSGLGLNPGLSGLGPGLDLDSGWAGSGMQSGAAADVKNQAGPRPVKIIPSSSDMGIVAEAEGMRFGAVRDESRYELPPIDLLSTPKNTRPAENPLQLRANAARLEQALRDFKVEARVANVTVGPTVTRYEVEPEVGVRIQSIRSLEPDLALKLEVRSVRVVPMPGQSVVGIEAYNANTDIVSLREIVDSGEFRDQNSKIAFALGKNISGKRIITDLSKMPHLMIAGTTGSGKSVCINSILLSFLFRAKPSEVKLILVDPKVVELKSYNDIPHLLVPVVTDPERAAMALAYAVTIMTDRYKMFSGHNVRNLDGYNEKMRNEGHPEEVLPQIVIVIDELSDLMAVAKDKVQDSISRLAAMARAAGMHLIVATQQPLATILTSVIKANIPSRIAFSVSSNSASRVILDNPGAERLHGNGDMLFAPVGEREAMRVQGAFVSDSEVQKVTDFIKKQMDPDYSVDVMSHVDATAVSTLTDEEDELFLDAVEMVAQVRQASVSMIQRRFRVGYNRAARLVDMMEERGIVVPSDGTNKPRRLLMGEAQIAAFLDSAGRAQTLAAEDAAGGELPTDADGAGSGYAGTAADDEIGWSGGSDRATESAPAAGHGLGADDETGWSGGAEESAPDAGGLPGPDARLTRFGAGQSVCADEANGKNTRDHSATILYKNEGRSVAAFSEANGRDEDDSEDVDFADEQDLY